MRTYNVKIVIDSNIDWEKYPNAPIDTYLWDSDYSPNAGAQVVYVKSGDEKEGIYAHLWCEEKNPRAIYKKHNDPVFKDSCLEFFFTMNKAGSQKNGYINIESNSNPTTLIGYGHDRYDRVSIVDMGIEPFKVTGTKSDERWDIYEFIPLEVIKKVFGVDEVDETVEFAGNFYKCGGDHDPLPYGMWSKVNAPTPDYHRPECFGKLKLER